jgi:hypothetical protein
MTAEGKSNSTRSVANTRSASACAARLGNHRQPLQKKIRAAARIDFREGQRPRLTQISSTANSIFLSATDL